MKKILFLLALFSVLVYPQANQTVDFVTINKQGMTNAQRDSGYTWGQTNHWRSQVQDIRYADSVILFVTAPDSFAVGVTANFYNSTDTANNISVAILDSITNVTTGVYVNATIAPLTNQFWTTVKAKYPGGVPPYVRWILTFNTTKNHDETSASTAEYFKVYAKVYNKPNANKSTTIK